MRTPSFSLLATITPAPVLNIVHEVLGKAIRTYVDTVPSGNEPSALFFKKKDSVVYVDDASNPPKQLMVFAEKTGLTDSEVEALLAARYNASYPSLHISGT